MSSAMQAFMHGESGTSASKPSTIPLLIRLRRTMLPELDRSVGTGGGDGWAGIAYGHLEDGPLVTAPDARARITRFLRKHAVQVSTLPQVRTQVLRAYRAVHRRRVECVAVRAKRAFRVGGMTDRILQWGMRATWHRVRENGTCHRT